MVCRPDVWLLRLFEPVAPVLPFSRMKSFVVPFSHLLVPGMYRVFWLVTTFEGCY